LTAEPGIYMARQAIKLGSNVHEDIVVIDLEIFVHPPQVLVLAGEVLTLTATVLAGLVSLACRTPRSSAPLLNPSRR
jgi:hypothetical protein